MDEREIATLEIYGEEEIAVLEESAGLSLAPLSNGAAAGDILEGKAAYGDDGSVIQGAIEVYAGTATAIPRVVPQRLDTARKFMQSDITIMEIPYYSVDNEQDGQTVIIGG